jgi:hypothetical protein
LVVPSLTINPTPLTSRTTASSNTLTPSNIIAIALFSKLIKRTLTSVTLTTPIISAITTLIKIASRNSKISYYQCPLIPIA